jgi:hypothetical protein
VREHASLSYGRSLIGLADLQHCVLCNYHVYEIAMTSFLQLQSFSPPAWAKGLIAVRAVDTIHGQHGGGAWVCCAVAGPGVNHCVPMTNGDGNVFTYQTTACTRMHSRSELPLNNVQCTSLSQHPVSAPGSGAPAPTSTATPVLRPAPIPTPCNAAAGAALPPGHPSDAHPPLLPAGRAGRR